MSPIEPSRPRAEIERIEAAYERRRTGVDARRYSKLRPGNQIAAQERQQLLLAGLTKRDIPPLGRLDILEVGCGSGGELAWLVSLGADPGRLHGIDLRGQAAEEARSAVPGATIVVGDASRLPYPNACFDVVYQATALSSMPSPEMRAEVAAEMQRVCRPSGVIVSYDFAWNPLNRDTVGIGERELRRLFPGWVIEVHRVTLAPPLGRWLGDRSVRLARVAAVVPWLRSHRLAFIDMPR